MPLDELEITLKPLLIEWKDSYPEIDFGDYVNLKGETHITELLVN